MEPEKLYKFLPMRIYLIMLKLNKTTANNITEIRLRTGKPFSLTIGSKNLTVDESGRLCSISEGVRITREDMIECLSKLTRSSLYSFDDTIRNGFIPLGEGMRAGVCGDCVRNGNEIRNFSEITSICLRVSRFFPDFAHKLIRYYDENGLRGALVISPPGIGKTTFLRSAAYLLSIGKKPYRVCLADERNELYVAEMENCLIDTVRNISKAKAMEILIRTMSPQIIVCDEISFSEGESVKQLQNSGITLIASCHGESIDGVMKKRYIREMTEDGVFSAIVRLYYNGAYESEIIQL